MEQDEKSFIIKDDEEDGCFVKISYPSRFSKDEIIQVIASIEYMRVYLKKIPDDCDVGFKDGNKYNIYGSNLMLVPKKEKVV